MKTYPKDVEALLDFGWNWADWLASGETIASKTVTVSDGITVDSLEDTDSTVTVWLTGGTAGEKYEVACRITTSAGRIDERTFLVSVRNR